MEIIVELLAKLKLDGLEGITRMGKLKGMDASTKISWLPNHKVFLEAKNQ